MADGLERRAEGRRVQRGVLRPQPREAAGEQVLVLANLTGRGLGMRLTDGDLMGPWREVWGPVGPGDQEVAVTKADPLGLTAWGVRVLVRAIG